ncbi:ABC transporter permease, partial [Rhodopirellula maiorica SM1]
MSNSASVGMPLELHNEPIMADPDDEHPLLRDTDRPGWWGWIDKQSERVSRHLNPILIKEARQSLKSRQFAVTFFLLLITSWFWMIIGVVTLAPDIYFVPSGADLMSGYYFLLAIPMIAMVPLAAHRSLAAELDEGTYELLAITRLTSMRIVTGKLGSAVLQMLVYFAALVPCFAFCYLLRGIDMVMISTTIVLVFGVSILLTTFGLLLATVVQNRAGQIFTLLVLLGVIVFSEFLCGAFVLEVILGQQIFWNAEGVVFTLLFSAVTVSCMVMFVRAAAARIAPITENRSTRLRWIMFAQQLIWIASIATLALWYSEEEVLEFGIMILGGYWLLMGTLMLGESSELSPRVLRT